jgi:2-oxoglutarate ferredoxin oxidoreductase subunit gamma
MRGGTAHCHVILNEGEVDSPLVSRASVLFAFNGPSLQRFVGDVEPGGLVVYDAGLITDAPPMPGLEVVALPATAIAERLGSVRVANIVALGAWMARTGILPPSVVQEALAGLRLKPQALELNRKALEEGMRFRP